MKTAIGAPPSVVFQLTAAVPDLLLSRGDYIVADITSGEIRVLRINGLTRVQFMELIEDERCRILTPSVFAERGESQDALLEQAYAALSLKRKGCGDRTHLQLVR